MHDAKFKQVVLVNGWSMPASLWRNFFEGGFEGLPVTVLDLDDFSARDRFAQKLDALIEEDTLLIGWSLGGQLALDYLSAAYQGLENVGRVRAAVMINCNPCFMQRPEWPHAMNSKDLAQLRSYTSDSAELVRRFAFLALQGAKSAREDRRLLKREYQAQVLPGQGVLDKGLDALESMDLRFCLSDLEFPCLWLLSEQDVLVPVGLAESLKKLLGLAEGSRSEFAHELHVIEGAGHFPCGEYASEIKAAIGRFMRSL